MILLALAQRELVMFKSSCCDCPCDHSALPTRRERFDAYLSHVSDWPATPADSITHRVVLNDRSVDTGDLAPGASSQPMAVAAAGIQYHCAIHPVMVGSVNQDILNVPDPCPGSSCY